MTNRASKQTWKPGDCFLVPLADKSYLIGQVLAAEPKVLNSLSCALFDQRSDGEVLPRPDIGRIFSTILTTRDLIDSGVWEIRGSYPVEVPRKIFPFEKLRSKGFVGAKVIGSGIVNEFANAFCGLSPWDAWADPNYLDRLLLDTKLKPERLTYEKRNR